MFPQRLKACRKQKGLSLTELAAEFDMSHSTLSKYESGTRHPDAQMLIKLASFFNVTTDYLLGVSDSPNGGVLSVTLNRELPPQAQKEMQSFLDYLVEKYTKNSK